MKQILSQLIDDFLERTLPNPVPRPWRNLTNNDLADSEGYYASVLYAFFSSLDARVIPEDITNHGQADLTVKLGAHIYVMEIKVVDTDNPDTLDLSPALQQIQNKRYAEKYRGKEGIQVHELGLVLSLYMQVFLYCEAFKAELPKFFGIQP